MDSNSSKAYPEAMSRLIDEFTALPGIGRRSAQRLAFHVLKTESSEALKLAQAIRDVKKNVRHCAICYAFADGQHCAICQDTRRDHSTILVVEQPKDVISLEQTGMFDGSYHILLGHLAPLDSVEPADLTITSLLKRIDKPAANACGIAVREVIFGLSPNLEGDGTVLYLADQLKSRGIKMTRLARGLPAGSQIEYANRTVLADAIIGRQDLR